MNLKVEILFLNQFSSIISAYVIAGPLAIVCSGFVAAYFWEKQGWPINKNPVSNLFRIMWIFFEPILFAFTGAQITVSLHFSYTSFFHDTNSFFSL